MSPETSRVDERGLDLAASELGVAARERDLRGDALEVRRRARSRALPDEEATTERDRVLGVIDETEAEAELREVRDRERRGEATTERLAEADRLLPATRAPRRSRAGGRR